LKKKKLLLDDCVVMLLDITRSLVVGNGSRESRVNAYNVLLYILFYRFSSKNCIICNEFNFRI